MLKLQDKASLRPLLSLQLKSNLNQPSCPSAHSLKSYTRSISILYCSPQRLNLSFQMKYLHRIILLDSCKYFAKREKRERDQVIRYHNFMLGDSGMNNLNFIFGSQEIFIQDYLKYWLCLILNLLQFRCLKIMSALHHINPFFPFQLFLVTLLLFASLNTIYVLSFS